MTLNVNTIEFNGQKAAINSFSDHPLMADSMNKQREDFAAMYPNAIVRTERMSHQETIALVAAGRLGPLRSLCHEIGAASNATQDVIVSPLPHPIRDGDWHDKPLRWTVQGPGVEVQNFSIKKWALKYASLRRRSASQAEASRLFSQWA